MIKKNDIYPTDGLKFGVSKQHGPWAMMKALGDRPGNIVSVFITNPEEIRNADAFKVMEIMSVEPKQRQYNGKWVQTVNVQILAEAVEFRADSQGRVSTPEDEVRKYMGI